MPPPSSRDQSLELFRLAAAFGIVAFHSRAPGTYYFYAGLVFFVFLSPFIETRYHWEKGRPTGKLLRTFLFPWAFWYIIYGLLNLLDGKSFFPSGTASFSVVLLVGPSVHLWFMPAMLIFLLILARAKERNSRDTVFWVSLLSAVALTSILSLAGDRISSLRVPYAQWLHATPAALWGVAFGSKQRKKVETYSFWIASVISIFLFTLSDSPEFSVTYPLGILLTLLVAEFGSAVWPNRLRVQALSSCTLGVYMSHIAFIAAFEKIFPGHPDLISVAAFSTSLSVVFIFRKHFQLSKHVLG